MRRKGGDFVIKFKVRVMLAMRDMTQKELARRLGCTAQYLHKILSGERSGTKYTKMISTELGFEPVEKKGE